MASCMDVGMLRGPLAGTWIPNNPGLSINFSTVSRHSLSLIRSSLVDSGLQNQKHVLQTQNKLPKTAEWIDPCPAKLVSHEQHSKQENKDRDNRRAESERTGSTPISCRSAQTCETQSLLDISHPVTAEGHHFICESVHKVMNKQKEKKNLCHASGGKHVAQLP